MNQWESISALGKKLVTELSLNDTNDTIGKWLVHYLAELFEKEENSEGSERGDIRTECTDVILKIWMNRKGLPSSYPPLQSFDEIVKVINKLRANEPYYYKGVDRESELPEAVLSYLSIAADVDQRARKLVNYSVDQAIAHAAAENIGWLKEAISLIEPDDREMKVVMNIIGSRTDKEMTPTEQNDELCRSMIEFGELLIKVGKSGISE